MTETCFCHDGFNATEKSRSQKEGNRRHKPENSLAFSSESSLISVDIVDIASETVIKIFAFNKFTEEIKKFN